MHTHLSLFSGIGGLDLAAEWAGFTTVGQCEWADYPTKILEKHWPDVPRWRDIHDLTGEDFRSRTGLRTVDVISGGFPCQPFSVAGKQAGKEDERYLFPEMLRVISELKPRFVVGENVPGILSIAAADVVESLEREGYQCVVFDFEAAAVGASHRRERIFFVAHSDGRNVRDDCDDKRAPDREIYAPNYASVAPRTKTTAADGVCDGSETRIADSSTREKRHAAIAFNGGLLVCHADEGMRRRSDRGCQPPRPSERRGWPTEPDVGRVAHGVPDRVDRLKCLGNAVVPQQAYPIFRAIMEEMQRT